MNGKSSSAKAAYKRATKAAATNSKNMRETDNKIRDVTLDILVIFPRLLITVAIVVGIPQ